VRTRRSSYRTHCNLRYRCTIHIYPSNSCLKIRQRDLNPFPGPLTCRVPLLLPQSASKLWCSSSYSAMVARPAVIHESAEQGRDEETDERKDSESELHRLLEHEPYKEAYR